jgi:hypothetical protein
VIETRTQRQEKGEAMAVNLKDLFERAKRLKMTPAAQEEQRRSFAYGNVKLANDLITREMIDAAAERLAKQER